MAQNNKRQQSQGQQGQGGRQVQQRQQQGRGGQGQQAQGQRADSGSQDIWSTITPALQEAREFIEGSPLRAAAIGAIAGGALMTLFSTEKGRSLARMAYDYANPMIAKYARDYVSQTAGNMTESALSQH